MIGTERMLCSCTSVGGRASGLIVPAAAFRENMLAFLLVRTWCMVDTLEDSWTTLDHCFLGSPYIKEDLHMFVDVTCMHKTCLNKAAFPWPAMAGTVSNQWRHDKRAGNAFVSQRVDPPDSIRTLRCGKEDWLTSTWAMVYQHYQHISIFCPHLRTIHKENELYWPQQSHV